VRPPPASGLWLGFAALLSSPLGCARWERPVQPAVVEAMQDHAPDLAPAVLSAAVAARACGVGRGDVDPRRRQPHLAVIDFSVSSSLPRLWVFDVRDGSLVFHERVAHGSNTGEDMATVFSDVPESHCSSMGAFSTAELYRGKHGLSMRLDGLEDGVNGHARERDIVVHGADYVSEEHVAEYGRLGRSWGCPAVRVEVSEALVRTLADRAMLLAWYPDSSWLEDSKILHCTPDSKTPHPQGPAFR
jgi:hypothetical protein